MIKKSIKKLLLRIRKINSNNRVLPDFIIVGAQKAGTTSLFRYLTSHPQIKVPFKTKEIHFFDGGLESEDNYKKGLKWYKSHFALKSKMNNKLTYEASPLYLFHPCAPKRIKKDIPDVKIIILLRNPVERTISHYFHELRKGREQLAPDDAFRKEEDRLKGVFENKRYKSKEFLNYTYKSRSKYEEQIRRYLEIFPDQNILILKSELLFNRPKITLKKICNFLNIETTYQFNNLKPKNIGDNKEEINEDTYNYLSDFFESYNKKLKSLLGEDFDW